ncbi:phage tail tip lysozyme [Nocardia sp. NBC_00511]|uniref:phage tail tip lysozyme n=1 Tax=Nocardia sp. NBC_00511 TaxID=2903591 RepID=UPI002F918EE7
MADAPILDSYVDHAEAALRRLLDAIGDGSAQGVTAQTLQALGPSPLASGEMEKQYRANQQQFEQYRTDLDSLDTKVATMAAKSAEVSDTVHDQVTGLVDSVDEILRSVPSRPTVLQQLDAIGGMDQAIGKAADLVSSANDQLSAHADSVQAPGAQPSDQSDGSTSSPAGSYFPGSYAQPSSSSSGGGYPAVSTARSVSAEPISGGKQVQVRDIYQYLITKYGFTPAQAAGIMGNMQVESSFNTGASNPSEGAIGLCQWEGGRRSSLEAFAASQGRSVTDWQTQVDFMMSEMHGGESSALASVRSTDSPAAAAAAFDQYYERSSGAARGQRMSNAMNIANSMAALAV